MVRPMWTASPLLEDNDNTVISVVKNIVKARLQSPQEFPHHESWMDTPSTSMG